MSRKHCNGVPMSVEQWSNKILFVTGSTDNLTNITNMNL